MPSGGCVVCVQDNMRNQTLMSIDQLTQEMMRNNSRGFSPIYAINLPQWLPREVRPTAFSRMGGHGPVSPC